MSNALSTLWFFPADGDCRKYGERMAQRIRAKILSAHYEPSRLVEFIQRPRTNANCSGCHASRY